MINKSNDFATVVSLVIFGAGIAVSYLNYGAVIGRPSVVIGAGAALVAAFVAVSIKIAMRQSDRLNGEPANP